MNVEMVFSRNVIPVVSQTVILFPGASVMPVDGEHTGRGGSNRKTKCSEVRLEIEIGVNMEFIRSEDESFEAGVERAAELGFQWVEPMVHNGRELLSEAGYFHSFSMDNDPLEMKDILDRHSVRPSDRK